MFSTTIKGELSMYFIDDVLHLINYCHKPLNLRMFPHIWLFTVSKCVFITV